MTDKPDPDLNAMLRAFIDGELDQNAEYEMRVRLENDPKAAARAQDYRRQNDALHDAYDGVLEEPLPAEMRTTLNGDARETSQWDAPAWRIAAAIVFFVGGGLGGWWGHDFARPQASKPSNISIASSPYVTRAIDAHDVFAVEVAHPVEVRASEEQHLITWLTKRLGHNVRAPHLNKIGFDLIGGRLLPDDKGKPAAQFMYENRAGQRITLYISLDASRTETSFHFAKDGGTSAIYWIEGGLAYALAGSLSREDMLKAARLVYDALIA